MTKTPKKKRRKIKVLAEQYRASQQEFQNLNNEIQFISQSDQIGLNAIRTNGVISNITGIGNQRFVKDELVINNLEVMEESCPSNELLMNFTETIVKEEPKIKGVSISARKRKMDEDSKVSNSKIKVDGRFKALKRNENIHEFCTHSLS
uniref:Uncharacterized protein n=1 Tax=Glossina palpalis gambiensis TaxID=67801 RepID=A0A1B0BBZ3_9MUSC